MIHMMRKHQAKPFKTSTVRFRDRAEKSALILSEPHIPHSYVVFFARLKVLAAKTDQRFAILRPESLDHLKVSLRGPVEILFILDQNRTVTVRLLSQSPNGLEKHLVAA